MVVLGPVFIEAKRFYDIITPRQLLNSARGLLVVIQLVQNKYVAQIALDLFQWSSNVQVFLEVISLH